MPLVVCFQRTARPQPTPATVRLRASFHRLPACACDCRVDQRCPSGLPSCCTCRRLAPQVHVELMGRDATVCQALPKAKGCFQRGCVDRFTLYSHSGDMGPLLALKVGPSASGCTESM